ncbi:MAG: IS256 family transposase [Bacteroidales bacterium]|nr:IS256 family transposase [Bacteroidales bacterium]
MEKKKRIKRPKLEDLIPDKERREEVVRRMYQGDPVVGEDGIFTDLLQAIVNAALEGEMDYHLDESKRTGLSNRRNGVNSKRVRSRVGPLEIGTPRDRAGSHEPKLIGKWERELSTGMDDVILSLYARGQSIEDVRHQLRELYGVDISAGTISAITDRVWEEITTWQQRDLAPCYPIVYLDAIHYKVREDGSVKSKAVYSVYGVNIDGERDVLGLYLSESEGARHWGLILEDLKRRGVEDVFFFCVDGLRGFKQVIQEIYPLSIIQRCIVHMVRTSTRFVSYKDIKEVCADLKKIYTSANRDQAAIALEAFGAKWDSRYKEIRPKWEENWEELMAFMDYSQNIRRMIYTTNPVEALHRVMRKVTKSKGAWSSDKGLIKQLYLVLMHNQKSWKRKAFYWISIQRELLDQYKDRYEKFT